MRRREHARDAKASGSRSVAIGGNVTRSTIVTGTLYEFALARRYWLPAATVALIVLTGAALVIVQQLRSAPAVPPRMLGGINVAVADFRAVDSQGRFITIARADDLGRIVQLTLEKQSATAVEGASIETWPPAWTGRIDGADRAARRAHEIDADAIVYGTVQIGDDSTTLRSWFYLSPRQLGDAQELSREYQLGADIVSLGNYERNLVTFDDLNQRLVARTQVLEKVIFGLGQYQRGDFQAARAAFRSAEQQGAWDGAQGMEVLYLFSGYAAARSGDAQAARAYFARAQAFPTTRPRAELGISQL